MAGHGGEPPTASPMHPLEWQGLPPPDPVWQGITHRSLPTHTVSRHPSTWTRAWPSHPLQTLPHTQTPLLHTQPTPLTSLSYFLEASVPQILLTWNLGLPLTKLAIATQHPPSPQSQYLDAFRNGVPTHWDPLHPAAGLGATLLACILPPAAHCCSQACPTPAWPGAGVAKRGPALASGAGPAPSRGIPSAGALVRAVPAAAPPRGWLLGPRCWRKLPPPFAAAARSLAGLERGGSQGQPARPQL